MSNLTSYLNRDTVDYYNWLSQFGLFLYEKCIIEKYFTVGSKVIDIGCGTGRTTSALNALGYLVSGVDYSETMIKKAKLLFPALDFSVQNVLKLNYEDETFDCAIFSFNGLMLVGSYPDRKTALSEIMRVVRKNGIFFFTTPFLDNKVNGKYWKKKIRGYNKKLSDFTDEELLFLGDEVIKEGKIKFYLHIPFVCEIRKMIADIGCDILFEGRRLDFFSEECIEEELDDNYIWVVKYGNV